MEHETNSDKQGMGDLRNFLDRLESKYEHEDNEALGYVDLGAFVMGSVYSVNGDGAELIPAFVPTRHELEELGEYWMRRLQNIEVDYFFTGQTGSTEIRIPPFATRRLCRIENAIGADSMKEIVDRVERESRAKLGKRLWRIFVDGTKEERDAVVEETYRKLDEQPGAPGYAVKHLGALAMSALPELGNRELSAALRSAADGIERGEYQAERCDHDWVDTEKREKSGQPRTSGAGGLQRCGRCKALRLRAADREQPDQSV